MDGCVEVINMGERIYLKKKKESSKFMKFLKENGADYYESNDDGGFGVFIILKKYGRYFGALKLTMKGNVYFGHIDELCNNFVSSSGDDFYPEEQKWIIEVLQKTLKWRGK